MSADELVARHQPTLDAALASIRTAIMLGAVLPEPQDEIVEFVGAWRGDLNPSKTLIRPLLANPDFADLKGASAGDDFIEHLRQNERIDDVATQLDGLGKHRRNLAKERSGAS